VSGADGQAWPVSKVAGVDEGHDVALLYAEGVADRPALILADDTRVRAGDQVIAIGNPKGLEMTVSTGVIAAVRILDPETTIFQMTAPISPGSSGGPLLDDRGLVIGITSMFMRDGQNLNFAVPTRYVRALRSAGTPMDVASFASATRVEQVTPQTPPEPAQPATTEPERAKFPDAVAGFRFGSTIHDAAAACGTQLVGSVTFATCSQPAVDVAFARGGVHLLFANGRLTGVQLTVADRNQAITAIGRKYWIPQVIDEWRGKEWIPQRRWLAGKPGRFEWYVEGGRIVLASLDGKVVDVMYLSALADAVQQENY
jgi:hypothetical protein